MKTILYRIFSTNPMEKAYTWAIWKDFYHISEPFYVEIPEGFQVGESVIPGTKSFFGENQVQYELTGGEKTVSLVGDEIVDLKILGPA